MQMLKTHMQNRKWVYQMQDSSLLRIACYLRTYRNIMRKRNCSEPTQLKMIYSMLMSSPEFQGSGVAKFIQKLQITGNTMQNRNINFSLFQYWSGEKLFFRDQCPPSYQKYRTFESELLFTLCQQMIHQCLNILFRGSNRSNAIIFYQKVQNVR